MGRNFILNVADKGFTVLGYDLDPDKVAALKKEGASTGRVAATTDLNSFVAGLARPRKIMMLVPAGSPVDAVIEAVLPLLEEGDILVDGGNSFYQDTDRRETTLKKAGIHFFGTGISGGAEGARLGPSIMPGGSQEGYAHLKPIFEAVAAQFDGAPCVAYLGPKSAGHYVKMVHNGIEYALMQTIAEVYDLLTRLGGLEAAAQAELFTNWNQGRLHSYLVGITANILNTPDPLGDGSLVDKILDKAQQKGTGKWTSREALDLGIPVSALDAAVGMRQISALKTLRETAETHYPKPQLDTDASDLVTQAEATLYFAFVVAYAQGMHLLTEASRTYGYNLPMAEVAELWRAGCIIRAGLLKDIAAAFRQDANLENLLLSPAIAPEVHACLPDVRRLLVKGIQCGVPTAVLSASLAYMDALSSGCLPLNLVQAQRDYFGAHTYERTDRDGVFHSEWKPS